MAIGSLWAAVLALSLQGPSERVSEGPWGGDGTVLEVAEQGATVEWACAYGSITAPLALDGAGRFDLAGTYVKEGPGPVREGETEGRPARYQGVLRGDTLELTVSLVEPETALGTFTLTKGKRVALRKCL
jgi:hypothetical protein